MKTDLSENMDLVLGPWGGAFAGLVIGGALTQTVGAVGLDIPWPHPAVPLLTTTLLGGLYGACQLRVPVRGLVAVGVFYGIFLWVLTNLLGWVFFPMGVAVVKSWPGFFAFVAFSFSLAVCSVVVTLARPDQAGEMAQH